jgi:hypothetical protein
MSAPAPPRRSASSAIAPRTDSVGVENGYAANDGDNKRSWELSEQLTGVTYA